MALRNNNTSRLITFSIYCKRQICGTNKNIPYYLELSNTTEDQKLLRRGHYGQNNNAFSSTTTTVH